LVCNELAYWCVIKVTSCGCVFRKLLKNDFFRSFLQHYFFTTLLFYNITFLQHYIFTTLLFYNIVTCKTFSRRITLNIFNKKCKNKFLRSSYLIVLWTFVRIIFIIFCEYWPKCFMRLTPDAIFPSYGSNHGIIWPQGSTVSVYH
jgi:hypothetical protein